MTEKFLGTDEKGRLNLSRKDALPKPEGGHSEEHPRRPFRKPID